MISSEVQSQAVGHRFVLFHVDPLPYVSQGEQCPTDSPSQSGLVRLPHRRPTSRYVPFEYSVHSLWGHDPTNFALALSFVLLGS